MDFFSFITLGGGLAMFLYGMDLMGDGLKSSSAGTLKSFLSKVTSSVFFGFMLGVAITALIQSSTATIVICIGLLGAGMLDLRQAVSITMGANVGTTITAQIIRLLDVEGGGNTFLRLMKPDTLAPIALILGIILIMAVKKDSAQNAGKIAIGFGILFVGLLTMTDAMAPLSESQSFKDTLLTISDRPIYSLFLALGFTSLVQSSSASVGVLQTLCSTGLITFRIGYFYVVGAALGTCITTSILCWLSPKADVKRVGVINVLFNIIGTVIIVIAIEAARSMGVMPELWDSTMTSGGVADFQTIFKLVNAMAFLPFVSILMKASKRFIKDDAEENKTPDTSDRFDTHLFNSPALALEQCERALSEMSSEVEKNFKLSVDQMLAYDKSKQEEIETIEEGIDGITDKCSLYLIDLSSHVDSDADSEKLSDILQALSEFERIGDHAINLSEIGGRLDKAQTSFSEDAIQESRIITKAVAEIINLSRLAFVLNSIEIAKQVEPIEETIDDLVEYCRESHIERLKDGQCSVDRGIAFIDMLTNLERIADQCSNLALMVIQKNNPEINKHEYISRLHGGEDEAFNTEYARIKSDYMGMMTSVSHK